MPFDAIEYINTPRWLTSRLGLERIRELLDRLGRPQDRLKFVHVAGTNGKGSTCAFAASILAEAGFKTGLFTSPYVETFHERIRVNGLNISDEDLTAATLRVRECAEAMEAEGGEHPTEFELMTAVALVHFAHVGCDIVVLEVGLGGRLDSTNVIAASEVAAIVSIALDHTNLLGSTLAEIAHEKAGIVKEGSTVVSWPQEPSAMEVVEGAARRVGDKLVVPDFSMLSVGKVTRGAAPLTRGTALEHEGHAPCSDSPRFAAELRAEHAPHAQELQAGAEGGSTCETASERGQHAPCSDSPRFAAELRAEHVAPAQKLQVSSSIDAGFGGRMPRAVPHEPNVPSGTFVRAQDCLSMAYAHRTPMSQVEGTLPMRQFSYRGCEYATRLLGSYQPSNAAMAIEIAGALRERGWEIPDEAIARGIAETRWPARFEVLDQPAGMPTVVIDGGHNPQGAGVLADSLCDVFPDKRPVFLVGILADKDYRSMLRAVAPLASAFVCVTPPNPRALDAADLAEAIRETCDELGVRTTVEVAGDFDDAVSAARKIAGPEGLICAFGSLYSVADVKAAFLRAADSNSLQS
ncbi:folylpolyglutamate synthase/dihydrofolate synthase family protein [uncultured Ellagibacter sp.]|uniref:bifunctional folylpolyglutamate synthase/dihydrofolate synthase n=1 Tax=uncultured Ellagibacter sp. TaxID=2137580 RepID=UPI00260344D6|nr:folylpolyglutamate synthase/dihydrofolate synthase family protein [uncultured Ellagibacter sp.]